MKHWRNRNVIVAAAFLLVSLGLLIISLQDTSLPSQPVAGSHRDVERSDVVSIAPGVSAAILEPLDRRSAFSDQGLLQSKLIVTVLDEGGRAVEGCMVSWMVLWRVDASARDGMHGTATTQAQGWCEASGLRIGDLVSFSAVHADGAMTIRPVSVDIVSSEQHVSLTLCSLSAVSVAWLDSLDGLPVKVASVGTEAVIWTGPGGESVDGLRVRELQGLPLPSEELKMVCSQAAQGQLLVLRQGGPHELPTNVKVRFAGYGYRSMVADVPLVPLRIALKQPIPIVVERLPGMVRVEFVLQEEPPGRADGLCFLAVRIAEEPALSKHPDLVFRSVDAAQPFSCVLPEGSAKVGFAYSSEQSLHMTAVRVSAPDGQVVHVLRPASCSFTIISTDVDGYEVPGLVLKKIQGLDTQNKSVTYESAWPTLSPGRITIPGLIPGRYEVSYVSLYGEVTRVVDIRSGERFVIADRPPD